MSSGEADQRARLVSGTCQQVYTALGVFYHTLHGPSWVNQSGWLKPGVPYCSYFGVKCDSAGLPRSMYVPLRPATPPCLSRSYGCLASTLVENKLEGTLDGASLNLSSLVALDISRNNIVGSLPSALAHLVPRLRLLYARGNRLKAPLPAMPATLQHLFLDENVLQGQLDPSVFPTTLQVRQRGWFAAASTADDVETVFVQTLRLGENQFDGTLPVSLARLTRLEVLHLNGNLFEGTVPVEYTELRSLESLLLFDNALSGSAEFLQGYVLWDFPAWLACVGVNSGVAYVCSCLWCSLTRLENIRFLILTGNSLTGLLPLYWNATSRLEVLSLAGNEVRSPTTLPPVATLTVVCHSWHTQIYGPVPPMLFQHPSVQILQLSGNLLGGKVRPAV